MNIEIITTQEQQMGVADGNEIIINNAEDGTNLIGDIYYQGIDKLIINKNCITPSFFDLKNGMAGEILQKFSNYRVRLVIFGDWNTHSSNSLREFIFECNKGKQINFVTTKEDAINTLSDKL